MHLLFDIIDLVSWNNVEIKYLMDKDISTTMDGASAKKRERKFVGRLINMLW